MMSMPDDYTIKIDAFQGPLDLLMYLIRRAEVDITDIPITEITNQYLKFLEDATFIDIDAAGEFLVMAATLMEIKSRMLMPPIPARDGATGEDGSSTGTTGDTVAGLDQADPRYELVRQLLEYKKFRAAAHELNAQRLEWEQRFPLAAAGVMKKTAPGNEPGEPAAVTGENLDAAEGPNENAAAADLEDLSVWDLAQTFQRIIAAIDFGRLGAHQIEADDTPIELHQEDLLDQLNQNVEKKLSLRTVFTGRARVEAIGLFLATLELVRQRRIRVRQDRVHDDIILEPVAAESETAPETAPEENEPTTPTVEIEIKPNN